MPTILKAYLGVFFFYSLGTYIKYVVVKDNFSKFIECIAPWSLIPLVVGILFFIILSIPEKKQVEDPPETESQMLQRHEREISYLKSDLRMDIRDTEKMFKDMKERLKELEGKLEESLNPKVLAETPEENKTDLIDNILN